MAENDTHTTDGERYRTPAHPRMVSVLGRALWNRLSLEEGAVAILYESGEMSLVEARSKTAGGKEQALARMAERLEEDGAPEEILEQIRAGIEAFSMARSKWRNAISHAHPYATGREEDGTYLPGLGYTAPDGNYGTLAGSAEELHRIAHQIEEAISPLADARRAVREFVGEPQ